MNTDNKYVVELFIPTESSATIEIGVTQKRICEKKEDIYIDIETKNEYTVNSQMCARKVISVVPLSTYYYKIGLKRKNFYKDKNEVHGLVKSLRKSKHI